MPAVAVAGVEVTLNVSLEREMQGKGIWRSVLIPNPGIAEPAECTEGPTIQVPLQGF